MKILELCLSPDLGGLELYMFRCCEALSRNGDEIFPVIRAQGRLQTYFKRLDLEPLMLQPGLAFLPLMNARRIARLIDREQIDAVHVHWGKDLPLAALAKAFSRRKPRLVYTRQMMLTRPKNDFYHRFLYRQMDLMLTITRQLEESARQFLPGDCAEKVTTLYYGVSAPVRKITQEEREKLRAQWKVPESGILIGLFGRIEAFKGQHLMLDALADPCLRESPVYLLIVGHAMDHEYLGKLHEQVISSGLEGRVQFFDFVDEPQIWMQACDVVALTTEEETFGLVLIEAMRAGTAVIGSNAGGVPEIIQDDETGLLFETNSSSSLAKGLSRLAGDPAYRHALAKTGEAYAERKFSADEHYKTLRIHLENTPA